MYSLLFLLLAGCATAADLPAREPGSTASSPPASRSILVHGHRGARASRPENTIAAFRFALEKGVDFLELDLQVTRDRRLVIHHDPAINRDLCLDHDGRRVKRRFLIKSLSEAEVRSFDCGSIRHEDFDGQEPSPGERIPTFDEFAAFLKAHPAWKDGSVGLNVEIKIEPGWESESWPYQDFVRLVLEAIRAHGLEGRVILQSFKIDALKEIRKLASDQPISFLVRDTGPTTTKAALKLAPDWISPRFDRLSESRVKQFQAAGIKVVPWTPGSEDDWAELRDWGVDAMITDDPEGLIRWREASRNPKAGSP